MGSGGLELPPGDEGHEERGGSSADVPPGAVSLARPMERGSNGRGEGMYAPPRPPGRPPPPAAGPAEIVRNQVENR
ncbi:hypothetical protein ACFW5G_30875, partial [Streptomyces griseoaurantiacus]